VVDTVIMLKRNVLKEMIVDPDYNSDINGYSVTASSAA